MGLPETNEEIVKKIQQGIDEEYNLLRLYERNKKFIRLMLRKSFVDEAYQEDAMQDAYLCMERATRNFDINAGYKFSTFLAGYLKEVISDYRYRHSVSIKISTEARQLYFKARKAESELAERFGRKPTTKEIAEYLEVSAEVLQGALIANQEIKSLQQSVLSDDEDLLLQDAIFDENSFEEYSKIEEYDLPEILNCAVNKLSPTLRRCIRLRFYSEYTIKEISTKLGLTTYQVSVNIDKGIKELRKDKTIQALKNYY